MRILVADDEPVARTRLAGLLRKWGYEVLLARDGLESWRILDAEDAPALAILDWMMPGMDGVEICRKLREAKRSRRYVYVLLLTGNHRKEDIVAGLEAGADDYLTKPFEPEELHVRLRAGRRILELEDALREEAMRDGLTRAWNRRAVLELLEREMARAARAQSAVSVILADLDHFKQINDTRGHQAGDAVLVETARRLRGSIRAYDGVGRYGGEEMLVVVPCSHPSEVGPIAARLRAAVTSEPVSFQGAPIRVTASFGAVASRGHETVDALIREADAALYRAKRAGRDRVELAPALDEGAATAFFQET